MKEAQQLNGSKVWGVQPRQQERYYSRYCQSVALQSGMRGGLILEKLYEVIKK